MQELISNYSKIVAGLCALIITLGYVTGHVSEHGLDLIIGLLVSGQAIHNGIMGLRK